MSTLKNGLVHEEPSYDAWNNYRDVYESQSSLFPHDKENLRLELGWKLFSCSGLLCSFVVDVVYRAR